MDKNAKSFLSYEFGQLLTTKSYNNGNFLVLEVDNRARTHADIAFKYMGYYDSITKQSFTIDSFGLYKEFLKEYLFTADFNSKIEAAIAGKPYIPNGKIANYFTELREKPSLGANGEEQFYRNREFYIEHLDYLKSLTKFEKSISLESLKDQKPLLILDSYRYKLRIESNILTKTSNQTNYTLTVPQKATTDQEFIVKQGETLQLIFKINQIFFQQLFHPFEYVDIFFVNKTSLFYQSILLDANRIIDHIHYIYSKNKNTKFHNENDEKSNYELISERKTEQIGKNILVNQYLPNVQRNLHSSDSIGKTKNHIINIAKINENNEVVFEKNKKNLDSDRNPFDVLINEFGEINLFNDTYFLLLEKRDKINNGTNSENLEMAINSTLVTQRTQFGLRYSIMADYQAASNSKKKKEQKMIEAGIIDTNGKIIQENEEDSDNFIYSLNYVFHPETCLSSKNINELSQQNEVQKNQVENNYLQNEKNEENDLNFLIMMSKIPINKRTLIHWEKLDKITKTRIDNIISSKKEKEEEKVLKYKLSILLNQDSSNKLLFVTHAYICNNSIFFSPSIIPNSIKESFDIQKYMISEDSLRGYDSLTVYQDLTGMGDRLLIKIDEIIQTRLILYKKQANNIVNYIKEEESLNKQILNTLSILIKQVIFNWENINYEKRIDCLKYIISAVIEWPIKEYEKIKTKQDSIFKCPYCESKEEFYNNKNPKYEQNFICKNKSIKNNKENNINNEDVLSDTLDSDNEEETNNGQLADAKRNLKKDTTELSNTISEDKLNALKYLSKIKELANEKIYIPLEDNKDEGKKIKKFTKYGIYCSICRSYLGCCYNCAKYFYEKTCHFSYCHYISFLRTILILYKAGNTDILEKFVNNILSINHENSLIEEYLERKKETIRKLEDELKSYLKDYKNEVNSSVANGKYVKKVVIYDHLDSHKDLLEYRNIMNDIITKVNFEGQKTVSSIFGINIPETGGVLSDDFNKEHVDKSIITLIRRLDTYYGIIPIYSKLSNSDDKTKKKLLAGIEKEYNIRLSNLFSLTPEEIWVVDAKKKGIMQMIESAKKNRIEANNLIEGIKEFSSMDLEELQVSRVLSQEINKSENYKNIDIKTIMNAKRIYEDAIIVMLQKKSKLSNLVNDLTYNKGRVGDIINNLFSILRDNVKLWYLTHNFLIDYQKVFPELNYFEKYPNKIQYYCYSNKEIPKLYKILTLQSLKDQRHRLISITGDQNKSPNHDLSNIDTKIKDLDSKIEDEYYTYDTDNYNLDRNLFDFKINETDETIKHLKKKRKIPTENLLLGKIELAYKNERSLVIIPSSFENEVAIYIEKEKKLLKPLEEKIPYNILRMVKLFNEETINKRSVQNSFIKISNKYPSKSEDYDPFSETKYNNFDTSFLNYTEDKTEIEKIYSIYENIASFCDSIKKEQNFNTLSAMINESSTINNSISVKANDIFDEEKIYKNSYNSTMSLVEDKDQLTNNLEKKKIYFYDNKKLLFNIYDAFSNRIQEYEINNITKLGYPYEEENNNQINKINYSEIIKIIIDRIVSPSNNILISLNTIKEISINKKTNNNDIFLPQPENISKISVFDTADLQNIIDSGITYLTELIGSSSMKNCTFQSAIIKTIKKVTAIIDKIKLLIETKQSISDEIFRYEKRLKYEKEERSELNKKLKEKLNELNLKKLSLQNDEAVLINYKDQIVEIKKDIQKAISTEKEIEKHEENQKKMLLKGISLACKREINSWKHKSKKIRPKTVKKKDMSTVDYMALISEKNDKINKIVTIQESEEEYDIENIDDSESAKLLELSTINSVIQRMRKIVIFFRMSTNPNTSSRQIYKITKEAHADYIRINKNTIDLSLTNDNINQKNLNNWINTEESQILLKPETEVEIIDIKDNALATKMAFDYEVETSYNTIEELSYKQRWILIKTVLRRIWYIYVINFVKSLRNNMDYEQMLKNEHKMNLNRYKIKSYSFPMIINSISTQLKQTTMYSMMSNLKGATSKAGTEEASVLVAVSNLCHDIEQYSQNSSINKIKRIISIIKIIQALQLGSL